MAPTPNPESPAFHIRKKFGRKKKIQSNQAQKFKKNTNKTSPTQSITRTPNIIPTTPHVNPASHCPRMSSVTYACPCISSSWVARSLVHTTAQDLHWTIQHQTTNEPWGTHCLSHTHAPTHSQRREATKRERESEREVGLCGTHALSSPLFPATVDASGAVDDAMAPSAPHRRCFHDWYKKSSRPVTDQLACDGCCRTHTFVHTSHKRTRHSLSPSAEESEVTSDQCRGGLP